MPQQECSRLSVDLIKMWLIGWLMEHMPPTEDSFDYSVSYYEQGIIDSLGVIKMIAAIEKRFAISFPNAVFADPKFQTINGLAEIIHGLQ